jgi:ABC-type sugar transport system substrate-binding protein
VQNPYEYGYKSVKVLAGLLRDMTLEDLGVDASRFVNIEPRMITAENVDEYWADLKAKTGR